jgi:hypothetical protein
VESLNFLTSTCMPIESIARNSPGSQVQQFK